MAYAITGSTSLRESSFEEAGIALKLAKAISGQENPPEYLVYTQYEYPALVSGGFSLIQTVSNSPVTASDLLASKYYTKIKAIS